ncbi:hypothetical protein [Paraburkholderia hospita]|jgi:phospholipase C|uniref:hypothetical protein n=1 Tax=Paraburkholderia hospita TaxID=169430 RepID=UPI001ABDFC24|nr:hypothetical protein [Paraburkholderia hospita]
MLPPDFEGKDDYPNKHLDRLSNALNVAAVAEVPPVLAGDTSATFNTSFNGLLKAGPSESNQGFHAVALQVARDHPHLLTSPQWADLARYVATYGKH